MLTHDTTQSPNDDRAPAVCGFPTVSAVLKVCEGLRTFRADHSHWSFDEALRTRAQRRKTFVAKTPAELAADADAVLNALLAQL